MEHATVISSEAESQGWLALALAHAREDLRGAQCDEMVPRERNGQFNSSAPDETPREGETA